VTEGPTAAFASEQAALLADRSLSGSAFCRAATANADRWIAGLFEMATPSAGRARLAVVAVGGYGRGELCPGSDLDIVMLHDGKADRDAAQAAERVWYPVWDQGIKLGHALRSIKESLALATADLDTATSLLTCRHIAGDRELTAAMEQAARRQWTDHAARWLGVLSRSVEDRHAAAGEVSFLLEPNLKDGRGGLRDVHSLGWAEAARTVLTDLDRLGLDEAYQTLLAARVELHRSTGRRHDVLLLQDQDSVASNLGDADADALMARIARAGRTISWSSDEVWRRIGASMRGGRSRQDKTLSEQLVLLDGEVHVRQAAADAADGPLALEAAAAAAALDRPIDQQSLNRLASIDPMATPWPAAARRHLNELLLAGRPAIRVIESLDRIGAWERILPEWAAVRCRPQRNAYHRFTVDRHLLETAANASALATSVDRPDVLVLGALLHDIGKGYPGDHTEVGSVLVRTITDRMGLPRADVEDVVAMVDHHLLLPDAASRRDLNDPSTIAAVAAAVETAPRLHLLAALTEADSVATGPAAWSSWKAGLVAELVDKVDRFLAGASLADVVDAQAVSPLDDAANGDKERIEVGEGEVTVVGPDQPATFNRIAAVLALHGMDVRAAQAWSDNGHAASRFSVASGERTPSVERVTADIVLALAGRLAIDARLAERAALYRRRPVDPPGVASGVTVRIDNDASDTATVIDVHAADSIGLLYRITRVLADMDLGLRTALVQTLGTGIADAFYVTDRSGHKVVDERHQSEIERAVLFACRGR